MLRVLMVLEDYSELVFLQTVLKKIGFDVDAIQNPRVFSDSLLSMNPEVLVMTAAGKRVRGVDLKKSVRRVKGVPHVIMLGHPESDPARQDDEAWLPSPVPVLDLLSAIADVCGISKELLHEKFHKLRFKEGEVPPERVLDPALGGAAGPVLERSAPDDESGSFGRLQPSVLAPEEREARYKKFLDQSVPLENKFDLKQVQSQIKTLRSGAHADPSLENERRAFVAHLFKKKEG